jgi:uncharacterized protein with HEPN domain
MTRRDDSVSLKHMRDHAAEGIAAAKGRSRSDLDSDRLLALALTKLVEIIGEAAGRVSVETRSLQLSIPWTQIVGTRNRLVHGYDQVDHDILWQIVAVELPLLVEELEKLLDSLAASQRDNLP